MSLSLIVAVSENNVIGDNGKLPWKIPSDLKFFKLISSLYGTIIMGRKTWESLPKKPLKNRKHIILTKQKDYIPCCKSSSQVILENCPDSLKNSGALVIGGARIYEIFLPYVDTCVITMVHKEIDGDAFFPEKIWENKKKWEKVFSEEIKEDNCTRKIFKKIKKVK